MGDTQDPERKKKRTSAERRARTAFLKAEREARQLALEAKWQVQVAAHFGYLETEYGFRFVSVDGSSWWGTFVRYQSPLLQVMIDRSVESDGVELTLIRLVDGRVPEYPIPYEIGMPINFIYFLSVLTERAPEEHEKLRALRGLNDEQLERSLALHADALRTYCDDALRGNLTVFDEETERRRQSTLERLRQKEREQVREGGTAPPGDETPSKPS
jgi:hypothetical protein